MDAQGIGQKITERFGGEAVEFCPATGDSFVVVRQMERLREVCLFLRDDAELRFDYPASLCGVDDGAALWVVYHLYSTILNHSMVLKIKTEREHPSVDSVFDVWPGVDWHEREAFDMFGIRFKGHPDLHRILLPDDWEGYPLRKDYPYPEMYRDIPLT